MTAKGNQTSPNSKQMTVQNLRDPLLDFGSPDLEISGGSLRALRPLRFKCNVWVQAIAQVALLLERHFPRESEE